MRRDFKQALHGLKDTYPSPDAKRMEEFLRTLPVQEERKPSPLIPLFHIGVKPLRFVIPAVVTAVLMLTVGIGVYKNYQPHVIDTIPPVDTSTTAAAAFGSTTYTETVAQTQGTTQADVSLSGTSTLSPTETAQTPASSASQTSSGVTLPAIFPTETGASAAVSSVTTAPSTGTLFPVQTTAPTTAGAPAQTTLPAEKEDSDAPAPAEPVNTTQTTSTISHTTTTTRTTSTSQTTTARQTTRPTPATTQTSGYYQEETTARTTRNPIFTTTTGIYSTAPIYTTEAATHWTEPATESPTFPAEDSEATYPEPAWTTETATQAYQEETEASSPCSPYSPKTLTVTYQPAGTILEWRDFFENSSDTNNIDNVWWHTEASYASQIITGRITDIQYTMQDGTPYTAITVDVYNTLRGSHSGGSLTIFEVGGYVPLSVLLDEWSTASFAAARTQNYTNEEIANTTVYEVAHYYRKPMTGDECMFFLNERSDGAYCYATSTSRCRLLYNGSAYVTLSGVNSVTYSEVYSYCLYN